MEATATTAGGRGWIVFSGLVLVLAGALNALNGLWALDNQDTNFDALVFDGNLEAWGWIFLIWGIVVIVAGIGVFNRAPWAMVLGVAAAIVGAVSNMFWLFSYPIQSLIAIGMYLLVLYGLAVYGYVGAGRND
jgi:hypothetical protein